ncbi:SpoIIE family protein phosphatase [candidate division KSB1 bacterium]|nr:SpoIIE family protein phosphatase [candidate division KSB1 bacterium]
MLLVLIVMATVTYFFTIRELGLRVDQMEERMERLANNIASIRSVETDDWSIYQTVIDNQIRLNRELVYIAILDENENIKAHALNVDWVDLGTDTELTTARQAAVIRRLMEGQIAEESQRDFASKSVNIMMSGRDSGTVRVGFSLVDLNNDMLENLYRNLRLGLIFLILAILMSLFLSDRIIKPLQKLTKAMLKIPAGDLDSEIHIESNDEIGEMAETFNFVVHGLREKKVIENFSRDLGTNMDLKTVCRMIRDQITTALQADTGILLLRDQDKEFDFHLIDVDHDESSTESPLVCDEELLKTLLDDPIHVIPLRKLKEVENFYTTLKTRFKLTDSAVLVPMMMQDACLGLFILQRKEDITENEKYFLRTLIQQGMMAIENALLLEEQAEKERLKRELEIARTMQQSLLPIQMPQIKNVDLHGCCLPAAEIGGDYFDFFELENGKLGIVIADVTGKGASAAFYMAVVKGLMLSLSRSQHSPAQLLSELNRRLWNQMDRKIFITMIYCILDPEKRRFIFSRAGHNGLMVKTADKEDVYCLSPRGIGLGLESGPIFDDTIEEEEIQLNKGDRILLFTDGAFETRNCDADEFGESRLMEIFTVSEGMNAAGYNSRILESISAFSEQSEPHDDITLITLKIL